MKIIQISGKGRVGKTTLANLIGKYAFELGYHVAMIPFAKGIKDLAEEQGITKEMDSSAYRDFCQELGARKREEDPDYWVARAYNSIEECMIKEIENKKAGKPCWQYVIIQDDVRYMNELGFGRDLSAFSICLLHANRELPEANAEWRKHESETLANEVEAKPLNYADLFDIFIGNTGTIQDLEDIVKEDLEDWLDSGHIELDFVDDNEETNNSDS